MKKQSLLILFLAISVSLFSQDCGGIELFKVNKAFEYSSYNNKNKLQGIQRTQVTAVNKENGVVKATIATTHRDATNKVTYEGSYAVSCYEDRFLIDIQSLIDPRMMTAFSGMKLDVSTMDVIFPRSMKVGDNLPDGTLLMKISNETMQLSEVVFTMRNRKVETIETITTPVGSFECFKISYELYSETKVYGFSQKHILQAVDYFSLGLGSVRNETYDKKGKLDMYTVLSAKE
jgi:hypothetical protein